LFAPKAARIAEQLIRSKDNALALANVIKTKKYCRAKALRIKLEVLSKG